VVDGRGWVGLAVAFRDDDDKSRNDDADLWKSLTLSGYLPVCLCFIAPPLLFFPFSKWNLCAQGNIYYECSCFYKKKKLKYATVKPD